MTKVTLYLEPAVALFYSRVAAWAGLPLEQVLCDSLQAGGRAEPGSAAKPGGKPIVISSRICYTKENSTPPVSRQI